MVLTSESLVLTPGTDATLLSSGCRAGFCVLGEGEGEGEGE